MRRAVPAGPCRAVTGCALIGPAPAVLDPLIDPAPHVVEAERVRLEAADLPRLLGREVTAILASRHARLELVAPPIFRLRPAARGVFPFGFARKPIRLLCGPREPGRILLRVGPAHIGDRRIVLATGGEAARLCSRAFVPFLHGHRILSDRERLDRDLVDGTFGRIVIASHREAAAANGDHLGFAERRGRWAWCWT